VSCCIDEELSSRAQTVVDALKRSGLAVITAESCTAGLLAAALSHGTDASECLHGGFVVYTKAQKIAALGIDEGILQSQGSVNAEIARQMAEGALRHSRATVAVAITGVLGPTPDEDNNRPGVVYMAAARSGRPTEVVRHDFGKREPDTVRRETVLNALDLLQRAVESAAS
jgi:nicotinamide-nucleotide amidase